MRPFASTTLNRTLPELERMMAEEAVGSEQDIAAAKSDGGLGLFERIERTRRIHADQRICADDLA